MTDRLPLQVESEKETRAGLVCLLEGQKQLAADYRTEADAYDAACAVAAAVLAHFDARIAPALSESSASEPNTGLEAAERLARALEPCFAERTDCLHGQWEAVSGDHYGEHLRAALLITSDGIWRIHQIVRAALSGSSASEPDTGLDVERAVRTGHGVYRSHAVLAEVMEAERPENRLSLLTPEEWAAYASRVELTLAGRNHPIVDAARLASEAASGSGAGDTPEQNG